MEMRYHNRQSIWEAKERIYSPWSNIKTSYFDVYTDTDFSINWNQGHVGSGPQNYQFIIWLYNDVLRIPYILEIETPNSHIDIK